LHYLRQFSKPTIEIAAAKEALATFKTGIHDTLTQLNEKVDAAYAADPTLWEGAATAKQKVDYKRNIITSPEDDKEATPTPDDNLSPVVTPFPAINYNQNASKNKVIVTIPEGITTIDDETTARIISDNANKGAKLSKEKVF
jgi:hypothetical protein